MGENKTKKRKLIRKIAWWLYWRYFPERRPINTVVLNLGDYYENEMLNLTINHKDQKVGMSFIGKLRIEILDGNNYDEAGKEIKR